MGVKSQSLDQPSIQYSTINALSKTSVDKMLMAFIYIFAPWLEALFLPIKSRIASASDQLHWYCCGLVRQARSACIETMKKQTQGYLLSPLLAAPNVSDGEAVIQLKHLLIAGVSWLGLNLISPSLKLS